jgi:AraC-like DNA-binding protein
MKSIPVIFRRWSEKEGGAVIAIFPTLPGDMNVHTCLSYMHVGQHGACRPDLLIADTSPCPFYLYRDLKAELEAAPYRYRLVVVTRLSRRFLKERRATIEEILKKEE